MTAEKIPPLPAVKTRAKKQYDSLTQQAKRYTPLFESIVKHAFSFSVPAFGASPVKRMGNTVPTPYAQYINKATATVNISSGGVNVTSYVAAANGITTRVEILTELQQYNGG